QGHKMHCDVTVNFGGGRVLELRTQFDESDLHAPAAAQQWLEHTYERLGCEPVRLSGKVLLLDRILAIAKAADYTGLQEHRELAQGLAHHAAQVLRRQRVTIDVPGLTVGY